MKDHLECLKQLTNTQVKLLLICDTQYTKEAKSRIIKQRYPMHTTTPSSQHNSINSESSHELLISLSPLIIVSVWFFFAYVLHLSALQNLDVIVKVTIIPVSLTTITILIVRFYYPIKAGFMPILRTLAPTILVYPVVYILIILRSNTGINGAFAFAYFFMTGGFWLIVGVILATVMSYFMRGLFRKTL